MNRWELIRRTPSGALHLARAPNPGLDVTIAIFTRGFEEDGRRICRLLNEEEEQREPLDETSELEAAALARS